MLDLSRVTLLFVETRAHEITNRVVADCLSKATFGDIVIYTDKPDLIKVPGARIIPCIDFPDKKKAGAFYYGQAMAAVETDYALMLEWDGGIFDPAKWRSEFFDFDYIGAPWIRPAGDTADVGNGGFTLMSKKLGHWAVQNVRKHPVYTDWDFCRFQRPAYEAAGFKWPDARLASFFAWELGPRNPDHFGFHGAFNWPTVLTKEEVVERARIMIKSEYLTFKMRDLFKNAKWLESELTVEEMTQYLTLVPSNQRLKPTFPGMMSAQQRQAMLLMQAQRKPQQIVHLNGRGLKA